MKQLIAMLLLTGTMFACNQCAPHWTCVASGNGGCKCIIDPGVSCLPCGQCAAGHCNVNCIQGPVPNGTPDMAKAVWVNDHSLGEAVKASPAMQAIVPVIQKNLQPSPDAPYGHRVLHIPSGAFVNVSGQEVEFSTWQSPAGTVTLRAKDTAKSKLVINDKGWRLYQNGKQVADGKQ